MKTKEKGYSLIVLIIAIIVILIITSGVISKINLSQEEKAINNFIYDMNTITEVARQYYSSTGTIPSLGKVNPPAEIGTQLNENDGEIYHQVDLKKLKLTDIHEPNEEYIINEESLVVYRLKGISYKGETYYTVTDELMGKLGKYERQDLEVAYAVSPTTWTRTANIKITIPSEVDATISDWTFKWNIGPKDVAFFQDSGHSFSPSEAFAVSQNGVYSVYIKDDQGKETIKNIIVNNVDDLAPKYQIEEDGTITLRDDETGIHEVRYKLKSEYDKNQSGRTPLDAYLEGGKGDTIEDLKNDIYIYYQKLDSLNDLLQRKENQYKEYQSASYYEAGSESEQWYLEQIQLAEEDIRELNKEYDYILDETIEYVLYVEDYAMNGTVILEGNLTFGKIKEMFNIPEKGEKSGDTIIFYVNENMFEAKAGATWAEFCEGRTFDDGVYYHPDMGAVMGYGGYVVWDEGYFRPGGGRTVGLDEFIVEEHRYGTASVAECVKGNTEILTSLTGEIKLAKEMMAGDTILYYDFANEKLEEGIVEKVYVHANATNFVTYTFADGSYIEVTDYHPIYTQDGWKSFTQRNGYEVPKVGDQVKTPDGWKTLEKIEAYQGLEDCYDFAIKGKNGTVVNNYFGNNTLVQNSID